MCAVMAVRAGFAGDISGSVIYKASHKRCRVMARAAIRGSGYMVSNLSFGIDTIMAG